jgi:hypothetical protein
MVYDLPLPLVKLRPSIFGHELLEGTGEGAVVDDEILVDCEPVEPGEADDEEDRLDVVPDDEDDTEVDDENDVCGLDVAWLDVALRVIIGSEFDETTTTELELAVAELEVDPAEVSEDELTREQSVETQYP